MIWILPLSICIYDFVLYDSGLLRHSKEVSKYEKSSLSFLCLPSLSVTLNHQFNS